MILHTYDRGTANSEEFVRVLHSAKGVFFPGGRTRVLDDTYHGTLLEREVRALRHAIAEGGPALREHLEDARAFREELSR